MHDNIRDMAECGGSGTLAVLVAQPRGYGTHSAFLLPCVRYVSLLDLLVSQLLQDLKDEQPDQLGDAGDADGEACGVVEF